MRQSILFHTLERSKVKLFYRINYKKTSKESKVHFPVTIKCVHVIFTFNYIAVQLTCIHMIVTIPSKLHVCSVKNDYGKGVKYIF